MQRRELLTAATTGLAGAMLASGSSAQANGSAAARKRANIASITTADGTQLFCRDWGNGPPIVFLSGWGLASDVWSYVMAPLAAGGFRCVAYDRRGHGRSTDPGGGYDYDTLADDFERVLQALNLRNATVVAHSMAGGEAVRYLSRTRTSRVARLVLVGTTLPYLMKTADNPDGVDAAVFEWFRGVITTDLPKWLQQNSRPSVLPETSEQLMQWGNRMIEGTSMQALVECNRAMAETDFRAELRNITVPTLLIHGDKDVSCPLPLSAAKVVKLMPNVELKIYAGPHGLPITHAAELREDLRKFVHG
jgi:non-heme chloroperoxidase